MRILNLYIARKLLFTTVAATGVLTFALLIGALFKMFDMLARGVPPGTLGMYFLLNVPPMLKFSLPLALLCSVILVFSRLAADNELTAMRASGVGVWQIVSPALLLGVLGSLLSFWLQMFVAPHCRMQMEALKDTAGAKNPLAVIEEGRFIAMPGYSIYVGKQRGKKLYNVRVYCFENGKPTRDISAQEGEALVHEDKGIIEFVFKEAIMVVIDSSAPGDVRKTQTVAGKTISFPINYQNQLNGRAVTLKPKYLDSASLIGMIYAHTSQGWDPAPLYLELHRRMSMSLAPFAFVLIGIPFGIRSRRSEAAISLVFSLVLATFFFAFLVLADSIKFHGAVLGQVLVWIPNVLYQIGGLIALMRLAKH